MEVILSRIEKPQEDIAFSTSMSRFNNTSHKKSLTDLEINKQSKL